MSVDTAVDLLHLARGRYGFDKARLAVLICPAAVEKVVDNHTDALESIRRLRARLETLR